MPETAHTTRACLQRQVSDWSVCSLSFEKMLPNFNEKKPDCGPFFFYFLLIDFISKCTRCTAQSKMSRIPCTQTKAGYDSKIFQIQNINVINRCYLKKGGMTHFPPTFSVTEKCCF